MDGIWRVHYYGGGEMTERKERSIAIGKTTGQIFGLVIHGAFATYFADKSFGYWLRGEWHGVMVNLLALAINGYWAWRLAARIAEKLEK